MVNGAPDGVYAIPSVSSFKVTIQELNIGARDTRSKPFGKFGRCTVTFKDLPFSDNHLDPVCFRAQLQSFGKWDFLE